MDWRIAHDAFVAHADEVLPDRPPPVRVLGIDETRRGKGRYDVEHLCDPEDRRSPDS